MKKLPGVRNLLNAGMILLLITIAFVPSAKALFLQGLMDLGFLSANVSSPRPAPLPITSEIKFSDNNGKVLSLGALKGKVVFLNFWATWCPPCVAEMPAINKLHQRFEKDEQVVFIMVDADSNLEKAQQFMNRKKYALPVYKVASNIPETLFQGKLPTTIVFDKQGRVVYNESGAANYAHAKFMAFIDTLKNSN